MATKIATARVNPANTGGENIDVVCPIRSVGQNEDVNCAGNKCMAFISSGDGATTTVDCRIMRKDDL